MLLYAIILECLPDGVIKVRKVIQEMTITVVVPQASPSDHSMLYVGK